MGSRNPHISQMLVFRTVKIMREARQGNNSNADGCCEPWQHFKRQLWPKRFLQSARSGKAKLLPGHVLQSVVLAALPGISSNCFLYLNQVFSISGYILGLSRDNGKENKWKLL